MLPHPLKTALLLPPLVALVGCGDSLVSGESLDDLLGLAPELANAAWEVRWVTDEGLVLDCELYPVEVEFEDEDAVFGSIELEAPEDVEETAQFNEVEDGAWALALLVLVDSEVYDPVLEEDGASLAYDDGVWGIVEPNALLFLDGDIEAVGETLWLDPDEVSASDSFVLVELFAEVAEADETVEGALEPIAEGEDAYEELEYLDVIETEHLDDEQWAVWSGEALGGAQQGCR